MSRRTKIIAVIVLAVVVAGTVVGITQTGGKSTPKSQEVVILNTVQRRTLQSTVALNGTLARKSLRNITAGPRAWSVRCTPPMTPPPRPASPCSP